MADEITLTIEAAIPGKDGRPRLCVGKFVMQGDWKPFDMGDVGQVIRTHPAVAYSLKIGGPNGYVDITQLGQRGGRVTFKREVESCR